MAKKIIDDPQLTSQVGLQGVSVTSVEKENDKLIFHGVYIPDYTPYCLNCDCEANKNGFMPRERRIRDIVKIDGKQQIITLLIKQQRYICPKCNHSVPYNIPFVDSRVSTTNRLNEHIVALCLDNSADIVSLMLKDKINESLIGDIFDHDTKKRLENYKQNIAAPLAMGIHRISGFQDEYFVLTDLEGRTIVEIYNKANLPQLNRFLMCLVAKERTTEVFSAMEPECMVPARSVRRARVSASLCSFFRVYSESVLSALEQYKMTGHRLIKSWLALPLYNASAPDARCQRAIGQLATRNTDLFTCVDAREELRSSVIPSWKSDAYEQWRRKLRWSPFIKPFFELLDDEKQEIYTSFGSDRKHQDIYTDLERMIAALISRSQKCDFEMLRARLLLSIGPERVRIKDKQGVRYYYSGISVDELFKSLRTYNT